MFRKSILCCILLACVFRYMSLNDDCTCLKRIYSKNIPSNQGSIYGFTCTGLAYNDLENTWYIGDAGTFKVAPLGIRIVNKMIGNSNGINTKGKIRVVNENFDRIIRTIEFDSFDNNIKDVQGVAFDKSSESIWFCSPNENKVWNVDKNGQFITSFSITRPSGLNIDYRDNSIWVLTSEKLSHLDRNCNTIKDYNIKIPGQDQIYLDIPNNTILITAGDNYYKRQYLYVFSIAQNRILKKFQLEDSYAVEGIYVKDNVIYILNDGYYHNAKIPQNLVNVYDHSEIQP